MKISVTLKNGALIKTTVDTEKFTETMIRQFISSDKGWLITNDRVISVDEIAYVAKVVD